MNASPAAHNLASISAPTPGSVTQIAPQIEPEPPLKTAPTGPKKTHGSGGKSVPKITRNGSLPIRCASDAKRKTSAIKPASRLAVAETTYKGKKAWRVSLGKRGKDLLSFRIRPSGSGFFVAWRSGTSERYVCYLAADEWRAAKWGSPARFARLILAKLDARRDAGETLDKISSLQDLVKEFA
jgi:hypothetical protein